MRSTTDGRLDTLLHTVVQHGQPAPKSSSPALRAAALPLSRPCRQASLAVGVALTQHTHTTPNRRAPTYVSLSYVVKPRGHRAAHLNAEDERPLEHAMADGTEQRLVHLQHTHSPSVSSALQSLVAPSMLSCSVLTGSLNSSNTPIYLPSQSRVATASGRRIGSTDANARPKSLACSVQPERRGEPRAW